MDQLMLNLIHFCQSLWMIWKKKKESEVVLEFHKEKPIKGAAVILEINIFSTQERNYFDSSAYIDSLVLPIPLLVHYLYISNEST